ncbi:MAG: DUF4118 domain-containing protein [Methanobacterium sp.]|nr:DUF4118 domain-containing protein [Methanobacterium sp.]
MVKDEGNVKFANEKRKKTSLERVKEFVEDLDISTDDTIINKILHIHQEHRGIHLILHYMGSILMVLMAFLLYSTLTAWFGSGLAPYILFYPAIIIVALLAGFGPGLLATIISVLIAGIWILPPVGQLHSIHPLKKLKLCFLVLLE